MNSKLVLTARFSKGYDDSRLLETYWFILDWTVIMFVRSLLGGQVTSEMMDFYDGTSSDYCMSIMVHVLHSRTDWLLFEHNSIFATGALFEGCICGWSLQGLKPEGEDINHTPGQSLSSCSRRKDLFFGASKFLVAFDVSCGALRNFE